MDLGEYYPCLKVADLAKSIDFYQRLGFVMLDDQRVEGWALLRNNNMLMALYQGHIERNLINFRGGDIAAIAQEAATRGLPFDTPATEHPDGSWSGELIDPDGNRIFFNTFPVEREMYLQRGTLVDE